MKKVAPQTCSVDCELIVQVDSRQSRSDKPTPGELRQLAYHNSLPFIGFGFLDNFIMIVAGEYIDLTLGMKLGISTMVSFESFKILAWLLFRQLQHWATPSRTWWGLGAPGNRITCYLMLNWKIWIIRPDCIFTLQVCGILGRKAWRHPSKSFLRATWNDKVKIFISKKKSDH